MTRISLGNTRLFYILSLMILVLFTADSINTSVLGYVDSPRKQMENGVLAEEVICRDVLQLMIRNNGNAICVKDSTSIHFVDSGFAEIVLNQIKETIIVEEQEKAIPESDIEPKTPDVTVKEDSVSLTPSFKKIHLTPDQPVPQPGDTIEFSGYAQGNKNLEITLLDPNEEEVFFEVFKVDSYGKISFEITTHSSDTIGTYFLIAEQSNDKEIIPVNIGKRSDDIQIVIDTFYNPLNSKVVAEIYGPPLNHLTLTIYDSKERTKFSDKVDVNEQGYAEILLDLSGYDVGIYSASLTHGTEEVIDDFTVGYTNNATRPLQLNLMKEYFFPGAIVYIFGESGVHYSVVLDVFDPSGNLVHEIESYTDDDGDLSTNFAIPKDAMSGEWRIQGTTGNYSTETNFTVYSTTT